MPIIAAATAFAANSELRAADTVTRSAQSDDGFSSVAASDAEPFPFIAPEEDGTEARLGRDSQPPFRYLTAKLSTGMMLRHVDEEYIYAGDVMLALGTNTNDRAGHYYGVVNGGFGRTVSGLFVWQFRMGTLHEWSIDRFRVGFTPQFG